MAVLLLQFPYSHYNEKARWALDYKGVQHQRQNMLPGTHRRRLKRLTGLSTTPVMLYNDEIVPGSLNIILRLEHKFPDTRRLLPVDEAERSEALALAASLDEVLGPAVRSIEHAALFQQTEYLQDLFLDDRSAWVKMAYRALFPVATRLVFTDDAGARARPPQGPATLEEPRSRVRRTMDRLKNRLERRGCRYLVGRAFSVADLTAAALLAPLVNPPHPDMHKPEPLPCQMRDLQAEMAEHDTAGWVLDMYAKHRPTRVDAVTAPVPRAVMTT